MSVAGALGRIRADYIERGGSANDFDHALSTHAARVRYQMRADLAARERRMEDAAERIAAAQRQVEADVIRCLEAEAAALRAASAATMAAASVQPKPTERRTLWGALRLYLIGPR